MSVSQDKKKEYNKKYREKKKIEVKQDEPKQKEDDIFFLKKEIQKLKASQAAPVAPVQPTQIQTIKAKIFEQGVMMSIPILLKVGFMIGQRIYASKPQQEQPQESEPESLNQVSNILRF